jgi:O-acetyl-ADP-ribose deacetylase (regulator of RNase III)
MPLWIIRQDITKVKVDCIVNSANSLPIIGGGVDQAIHQAAGDQLFMERKQLGFISPGSAKISNAYGLPARYVIHTVGPLWVDGHHGEESTLRQCYQDSLQLALAHGCESIAFPLISSGVFGYPKDKALECAIESIKQFLDLHDLMVYLVVYDKKSYRISKERVDSVQSFLEDRDVVETSSYRMEHHIHPSIRRSESVHRHKSLLDEINELEDTFSERLLKRIALSGMLEVDVYKRANIDRKLFSKIRSNKDYKPSKQTAVAFAFALRLSLDDTKELLESAGFALNRSSKFDLIVQYHLLHRLYDIHSINSILFDYDQPLLGSQME